MKQKFLAVIGLSLLVPMFLSSAQARGGDVCVKYYGCPVTPPAPTPVDNSTPNPPTDNGGTVKGGGHNP